MSVSSDFFRTSVLPALCGLLRCWAGRGRAWQGGLSFAGARPAEHRAFSTRCTKLKKWFHYCFNCSDRDQIFANRRELFVLRRTTAEQDSMQERRKLTRSRVFKGAKIVLGNASVIDCAVRNVTNSGARVQIANTVDLPDVWVWHLTVVTRFRRVELSGDQWLKPAWNLSKWLQMTAEQYKALAAEFRGKAQNEESPAFRAELLDLAKMLWVGGERSEPLPRVRCSLCWTGNRVNQLWLRHVGGKPSGESSGVFCWPNFRMRTALP